MKISNNHPNARLHYLSGDSVLVLVFASFLNAFKRKGQIPRKERERGLLDLEQ
jgi:hypothetical protein